MKISSFISINIIYLIGIVQAAAKLKLQFWRIAKMNILKKYIEQKISIEKLIDEIKLGGNKEVSFCIYVKFNLEKIEKNSLVYIDRYPEGDRYGNDVFPDFVENECLSLLYYGEQFEDVIDNVFYQKSNATIEDFVLAINFYRDHDNFISF